MLKTSALKFSYNDEKVFTFPAIQCEAGQELLLLGESGCGKTTLLHILAGLRRPDAGEVYIQNQELGALADTALDAFRGQNVGIVFQQSHLLRALTVAENLRAAQYFAHKPSDKAELQALLDSLNIGEKANSYPHQLSLGEQQRVAIARALINRPSLILADEPTSSLDDKNCREVLKLLLAQSQAHKAALVIVTHDGRLKSEISNHISL
jgi:putative ABC transport system ATP-binding protein